LSATALRCRNCETDHALEAVGICSRCWGRSIRSTTARARRTSPASDRGRPAVHLALRRSCPVDAPASSASPRPHAARRGARLAEHVGVGELWLKLDTANPTHSFKDRVVAVAAAKAQELGLSTLACSSTGNLANAVAARAAAEGLEAAVFCPADLEPEKLTATAAYGATLYAVAGNYDDCNRVTVELSWEVPWAFVNVGLRSYYAEGSKTIAYEIVEQLGWRTPDVVVSPIASGSLFTKLNQAFTDLLDFGLADGESPRLVGGQAEGCAPVATAFAAAAPCARCGRTRSPGRSRSAARPTATSPSRPHAPRRRDPCRRRGGGRREHGAAGRDARRVRRDGGRSDARGAARGRRRRRSRTDDRVVLLVTGDGLKTPGPSPTACSRCTSSRRRGRAHRPLAARLNSETSASGSRFTF
jgi:threonine synthase